MFVEPWEKCPVMNDSGLKPMEYNVVVKMDPAEERTASGLYLPPSKVDRDELATDQGTLIALSPHAFSYAEWPNGAEPPKEGDRVMFAQFAGRLWKPRGENGPTFRILKDKDIVAVVEPQPALAAVA
jgi:co-chaperonin GroES (HSP10)